MIEFATRFRSAVAAILAGLLTTTHAAQPAVPFTVRNDSDRGRREVVRVSLPSAKGLLKGRLPASVTLAGQAVPAQATVITTHPGGSARRVMVSFVASVGPRQTVEGACPIDGPARQAEAILEGQRVRTAAYSVLVEGDQIKLLDPARGAMLATVTAFGPSLADPKPATTEVLDSGHAFCWLRWRQEGSNFTRELDVQADALGRVKLVQRVQSHLRKNDWTPDFGFEFAASGITPVRVPGKPVHFLSLDTESRFADNPQLVASCRLANGAAVAMANPLALRQHRGTFEAQAGAAGQIVIRSARIEPVKQEKNRLMIQDGQWRIAEIIIQPGSPDELAHAIDCPLVAHADWRAYDGVYHTGSPLRLESPVLKDLVEHYVHYLQRLSIDGDDWGNMTFYNPVSDKAAINSFVRFNHCQYVWEDYFRSGDPRLLVVARDWSENYRNLSVYWGHIAKHFGGSRRGRALRKEPGSPHGPGTYMVRYDYAQGFVTKGYRNFWLAFEETGDPRFKHAAEAQAKWSSTHAYADRGEMRNVGMIADFAKMHEYTGDTFYLDHATRIWKEFQSKQMPDLMFTQGGRPATGNHLYIFNDKRGYRTPFYKAYITQYATNSLPHLLKLTPTDKGLRDTILACNEWMAKAQAGGGWGYPGPTSAGIGWSTEYCHGLMLAYSIEPRPAFLDAIQRTLRAIVALFQDHGVVPTGVNKWESEVGTKLTPETYRLGSDRDRSRDFTQGRVRFGTSPDNTVYFQVLLRDFLEQRGEPALLATDPFVEQLRRLPTTLPANRAAASHPWLPVTVTHRITAEGMAVRMAAHLAGSLRGKRATFRWELPDGPVLRGRTVEHTFGRAASLDIKVVAQTDPSSRSRTFTINVPTGPQDAGFQRWPDGIRIQAEAPSQQGGCDKPVRYWFDRKGADAGAFSHWDKKGHWIEYAFDVPAAGPHYLLLKYACPHQATRSAALDGKSLGVLRLPASGGYTLKDSDDYAVELLRGPDAVPLRTHLAQGHHTLRLANADGKGCNLDYIEWLPAAK